MINSRDTFFGRTELEWEQLEAAGWDMLSDCSDLLTTYTDLNNDLADATGQPPWNFSNPAHRNAMAHLLGRLADRSYAECVAAGREPLMISAVCKFMRENDAGDGFYAKALELQLIPEALYKDKLSRFGWWALHVGKVQAWLKERRAPAYRGRT
jgi:hypothetical protein